MSEEGKLLPEVIFNNESIEIPEIKEKLDAFFDEHQRDLSADQIKRLRDWFKKEVVRYVNRESQAKSQSKSEFTASALAYFLGRLEEQVRIAIEEPRLCPELANKVNIKNKFIELLTAGNNVVLVNIDLDGFKGINDKYNHNVGDTLLKDVGSALGSAIRPTDIGAHYSGDEFGILLNIEDSKNTAVVVSRIVASIRENVTRPDGSPQEMSVGVSIVDPGVVENATAAFETAYDEADKASELSKIIGLIPREDGIATPSYERFVLADNMGGVEKNIDPQKLRQAKVFRHLKRALADSYGEISPTDLAKIIEDFFLNLETSLSKTTVK